MNFPVKIRKRKKIYDNNNKQILPEDEERMPLYTDNMYDYYEVFEL